MRAISDAVRIANATPHGVDPTPWDEKIARAVVAAYLAVRPAPPTAQAAQRDRLIAILNTAFGPQQTALEPVLTIPAAAAYDRDSQVRLYATGDGIVGMLADAILAAGFARSPAPGMALVPVALLYEASEAISAMDIAITDEHGGVYEYSALAAALRQAAAP